MLGELPQLAYEIMFPAFESCSERVAEAHPRPRNPSPEPLYRVLESTLRDRCGWASAFWTPLNDGNETSNEKLLRHFRKYLMWWKEWLEASCTLSHFFLKLLILDPE